MSALLQKVERKLAQQQMMSASAPVDNSELTELLESINTKLADLIYLQAKMLHQLEEAEKTILPEETTETTLKGWTVTPFRDAADKILYCKLTPSKI